MVETLNKNIGKGDLRSKLKSKESKNGKVMPQEVSQPQDERPHLSKNDDTDLEEISYGDWLTLNSNESNSLAAKHAVFGQTLSCFRKMWSSNVQF